jgi:hypothetical protein
MSQNNKAFLSQLHLGCLSVHARASSSTLLYIPILLGQLLLIYKVEIVPIGLHTFVERLGALPEARLDRALAPTLNGASSTIGRLVNKADLP